MTELIEIDRSKPFDQGKFHCYEYRLVNNPQAERVTAINLTHTKFMQPENVHGQGLVHLDAKVFEVMWSRSDKLYQGWQQLIPTGQSFFQFYFWGTKLVNLYKVDHVLYLRWGPNHWFGGSDPRWHWGITSVPYNWGYQFPAIATTFRK